MIAITLPSKVCKQENCSRRVVGWGYCSLHYQRLKRYGDASVEPKGPQPGEVRGWLASHISFVGEECLEFPYGRNPKGYGAIAVDGFKTAHRWMCHEAHGPASEGRPFALHACGNGHLGCVNPRHLYWGSGADNYQDQIKHGVVARGERSPRANLTVPKVLEIRKLRSQGATFRAIASQIGSDKDAVRSVVRGRTWAWL